ncbi:UDP-3-O-(3-hydroxymyristoyl)glucosamine N-acyltransferase [Elizabethkingia sp. JS20170427COW]|uniref:UDP-3-O-(3-hydroxymyristoyl)glucosamine N-acyltransferase n=1 Tax=Elizabethkingia sp. JS20170427COW TaxID=2583851 RepID=UPI0011101A4D|nr:UDP-3-O-(3-hydroxymyristoyl)glucosamine N-acyltransferase [Elizabethkingia sp. JS20170427COW]QCX52289.1 UDP-3-O-(3-hydroxymyristoyl)glucosamine N-acyltransferase [Elizabethkingia sp. JS20170427COW]
MKFKKVQNLKTIAELINAKFVGDADFQVLGTNEIHRVEAGDIVFVNHPKYYDKALNSAATVVLIDQEVACPDGKALLISDDPFRDFNLINTHFTKIADFKEEKHNLEVGDNTIIHPSVVIGNDVKIGDNCLIHPNVVIGDRTVIGDNVIIQAGTVLGGDAFYYRKTKEGFEKLQSVGHIVLEDFVEIGVNCTIDRGVTDVTLIKKHTKIDNLVQIGHDTIIGEKCLIASQVGVAGCCNIGNQVTLWGQVGVAASITIEDNTVVLATSGVSKNLKTGTYFGAPAEPATDFYKRTVKINRLLK